MSPQTGAKLHDEAGNGFFGKASDAASSPDAVAFYKAGQHPATVAIGKAVHALSIALSIAMRVAAAATAPATNCNSCNEHVESVIPPRSMLTMYSIGWSSCSVTRTRIPSIAPLKVLSRIVFILGLAVLWLAALAVLLPRPVTPFLFFSLGFFVRTLRAVLQSAVPECVQFRKCLNQIAPIVRARLPMALNVGLNLPNSIADIGSAVFEIGVYSHFLGYSHYRCFVNAGVASHGCPVWL
jgi:hypothetical protein